MADAGSGTLASGGLDQFAVAPFNIVGIVTPLSLGDIGSALITSLTPAAGSQLSADPDVARFTPIAATVQLRFGDKPIIFAKLGSLWWLVYDGSDLPTTSTPRVSTGFAPFFRDHSTIAKVSEFSYSVSLLPNGGWWRSNIDIEFVAGLILTQ